MRSTQVSTLLVVAATALVVSAHVTVQPRTIRAASNNDFTIRVPTERPVPTVAVKVEFPPTLRVARLRSKPGWTSEVVRDTAGIISAVTWSGGRIPAGEWDEFVVAGRTADSTGELVFKAWQTYQGGEIVPWTGEAENRPAPHVSIEAAPAGLAAIPADRWMSVSALLLALIALTVSMRAGRTLAVALALSGTAAPAGAQTRYDATTLTLCERANPVQSVYVPFATSESTGLLDHPTDEHTPFLMSPGTPRAHIMFGRHQH